jgi:hypothetical protein
MQAVHWFRAVARLVLPAALVAALLAPIGCSGSERVKHKEITGVDKPADTRTANPHDEP